MLKTVLLDIDGTLLDSNDLHARAWIDALMEEDFDLDFSQVRPLIGMGADNLLPQLIGVSEDDPVGLALSKRRGEIFRERYLPDVKPFPGARELVERIIEESLSPVVATSASKEDLQALLEKGKLDDLLKVRVNADEAANSKPDPDIIDAALRKAGVYAEEAVMIGDTPYDIAAALKCDVVSIGFTCGGWSAEQLSGARVVYKGPQDLLHNWATSYFARSPWLSPTGRSKGVSSLR